MITLMTFETEQESLELVANKVGFEYTMYAPTSFPHRSGLLYKREHARMSVWNPFVDDGDLFRLAIATPAVNSRKIINSVSRTCQDQLETRCAIVREAFARAVAAMVGDSSSDVRTNAFSPDIAAKEGIE